jgi:hypothetical protein
MKNLKRLSPIILLLMPLAGGSQSPAGPDADLTFARDVRIRNAFAI